MAKAIAYDTEAEALQRSKDKAYSLGCNENTTTQYWWDVSLSTDGNWCCWIGDDSVEDTVEEKTKA